MSQHVSHHHVLARRSGPLWRETIALPLLVRQTVSRVLDGAEQEEDWPGFVRLRSCSAQRDGGATIVTACAYERPRRVTQVVCRTLEDHGSTLIVTHELMLQKAHPRRTRHADESEDRAANKEPADAAADAPKASAPSRVLRARQVFTRVGPLPDDEMYLGAEVAVASPPLVTLARGIR